MYWLKIPTLPVKVCGDLAGAASAAITAPGAAKAAAIAPAISAFLNMISLSLLKSIQYYAKLSAHTVPEIKPLIKRVNKYFS